MLFRSLSLWLTEVPPYAVSFCRLMLIFSLLDAIQGPLWISVQATGKIRNYQLLMGVMILSNLPISYLFLKLGFLPDIVLVVKVVMNVLIFVARITYLNRLFSFPIIRFMREVLVRVFVVTLLSCLCIIFLPTTSDDFISILYIVCISLIINGLLILIVGVNKKERALVINQLEKFLNSNKYQ